ncbi:MAG: hypothetical protein IT455_02735 [Planctomycetes bacterium]|nr:hypothetical protein [Planctomycetota bacterium]
MPSPLRLAARTFPARVADLGFTAELPADWVSHDLPAEDHDISDPTVFVPLAVVTAPHAALVFTFGGRPAYEDGTLLDWAHYLLQHHGLIPRAIGRAVVAGVPAVSGEATMTSEFGPMLTRFAFLEDGGRLVQLSLTAPELLADVVQQAWFTLLRTFVLTTPRGSRFGFEGHPDEVVPPAPPTPAPVAAAAPAPAPVAAPPREKTTFADFALAADLGSLEPEQRINQNLRDRGVGLVPNVTAYDEQERFAIVAAGAIVASLRVPFGWHAIDDGRRLLVFEPGGKVQLHFDRLRREGRDDEAVLLDLAAGLRQEDAALRFVPITHDGGRGLEVCGMHDGDQALEQRHLLLPAGRDHVLRLRVTATPDTAVDANQLAALMLASVEWVATDEPESQSAAASSAVEPEPEVGAAPGGRAAAPPEWWRRACEHEAAGRLQEAEATIRRAVDHIGFAASIAELYRQRMLRLQAAGDTNGADDAFHRATAAMSDYASMATSGGEGMALSLERDDFRAQLVRERGHDPAAVR